MMDCAPMSCNGSTLVIAADLEYSIHRTNLHKGKGFGHRQRRDLRWVCSALPVRSVGRVAHSRVKQDQTPELEREKWLSQLKSYLRQGKVDEAEELMRKMQQSGVRPDLLAYNSMITINGKANRFTSARTWFDRLDAEEWPEPDAVTYRSIIGACGRAGELKEALKYYDRMRVCGFCPSIQNFNTLIYLHRKVEKGVSWEERILSLLSDMRELGCCPDSSTMDVIVKVYERCNKLQSLSGAIALLEAAGWSPTRKCHGILLRAYIRCGLVDQALDVFQMLCSKNNVQRDINNYNAAAQDLKALAPLKTGVIFYKGEERFTLPKKKSTVDASSKLVHKQGLNQSPLNEASAHLSSLKPDIIVDYNGDHDNNDNASSTSYRLEEALCHSLICLCKTSGRYKEAMHVYNEMRHSGTRPSWITACTIIDVCGRLNEPSAVERGRALFEEMRSSASGRESTDAGAYTVTINMYLKAGLVQKAAEVSGMVAEHEGLVPDSALFLAMLRAYSRSGMHTKAVQVYKRMLKLKLTWTAPMFNGVIHCCGRALPLEEIIKVFLAMVYAKIPVSNVTCNLMMDIFAKAGLLEKAENVFKLAKEQRVVDAISYNTIIDAYGKYKEFYKMEGALVDMQNSGFKDHVEAYNSMLDAYGKAGQIRKMENILERLRRADCLRDLSTFNTLINVYGREGLIVELQEVRKNMEEAGIKPDHYTFNTLIHAYGNSEMPDEAMKAFREMQDEGLVPDQVTYHCLIAALEKSGNHLEAARWSLWMTQLGMK